VYDLQKENSELEHQNRTMKEEVERYKLVLADTKEELLLLKQQVKDLKRRHRESLNELTCTG
jgi:cell division septum initiation protein DivIVA